MTQHKRMRKSCLEKFTLRSRSLRNNFSCGVRKSHNACKNFGAGLPPCAVSTVKSAEAWGFHNIHANAGSNDIASDILSASNFNIFLRRNIIDDIQMTKAFSKLSWDFSPNTGQSRVVSLLDGNLLDGNMGAQGRGPGFSFVYTGPGESITSWLTPEDLNGRSTIRKKRLSLIKSVFALLILFALF